MSICVFAPFLYRVLNLQKKLVKNTIFPFMTEYYINIGVLHVYKKPEDYISIVHLHYS